MSKDQSPLAEYWEKTSPELLEEYGKKIPRRKSDKARARCCGLSCVSWLFLTAALFQGILVAGLQIAIAVIGDGRLIDYVSCLERSLEELVNQSVSIPANSSIPNFGRDKQIYGIFFIFLVVYNFCLVIYALTRKNIVEVVSFIIVNLLLILYGFLQVYQFRGFGRFCLPITLVGILALINAVCLLIFTVFFIVISLFIYAEFGWKIFVLVNGNPAMRYYFRVFRTFMSVVKLVIVFLIIFSIGQCILLLPPENSEFGPTILIIIAAILAFPVVYIAVTWESKIGAALIIFVDLSLIAYFIFKIYRFVSGTCPLCQEQIRISMDMRTSLLAEIGLLNDTNVIIPLSALTRAEDLQQLTIIAAVNLLFTVAGMFIFIHYLRQYGKGLKEHFTDHWFNKRVQSLFCKKH